jgi:HEAT repeat protein
VNAVLLSVITVCGMGCGLQAIQEINRQLQEAEKKLLKNPQDQQGWAVIFKYLKDSDTVARGNAIVAIGNVGEKKGAEIKEVAMPILIEALEKDNVFVRRDAAQALKNFGRHGEAAIPALIKNLRPSDSDVAWFSAEALGGMGELAAEAVPELVQVIKENESSYVDNSVYSICPFAAKALGEIGSVAKEAVPTLESLLNHQNPYFRAELAVALIRIDPNNQKSLTALSSLLKDQDDEVRWKTINGLEHIGKQARPAKKLIEAALKDKDADVSIAAADLLKVLDSQ